MLKEKQTSSILCGVQGSGYSFQHSLSDTQWGVHVKALMNCPHPHVFMPPVVKVSCVAFKRSVKTNSCRDHWIPSFSSLEKPIDPNERTEQPGGGMNKPPPRLSVQPSLQDTLSDTRVFNLGDCAPLTAQRFPL